MKAQFKPIWDHVDTIQLSEGQGVNYALPAYIKAITILDPNETEIELDSGDIDFVTSVKKNGTEVAYSIDDNIVTIPPSDNISIIELTRSGVVTIEHITGELVPGVTVQNNSLRGIFPNIPFPATHFYTFLLRAKFNNIVSDIQISIVAAPVTQTSTWNEATLPTLITNTALISKSYFSFGSVSYGRAVDLTVDVINPDSTALVFDYRSPTGIVSSATSYGSIPTGLEIFSEPLRISGYIPAEAMAGDYFFEVYSDDDNAPAPIIFHFNIPESSFDEFTITNRIHWETDTYIGTITEGLPTHLKISASANQPITFSLSDGSRPLPVGISLLPSGLITGIGPHTNISRFSFTAKATSGSTVSTKSFEFDIVKSFLTSDTMNANLLISGDQRLLLKAIANNINNNIKYRIDDDNFSYDSKISLIRGLKHGDIGDMSYDVEFTAIIKEYESLPLLVDGEHKCDVVFRRLYTPMDQAGGYTIGNDIIPTPVSNLQFPSLFITEGSFTNLRKNLVELNGLNNPRSNTLGKDGGEIFDYWMDDYFPAVVIAYVLPNVGKTLVNTLSYGNIPVGTIIHFDRLEVEKNNSEYFYYFSSENTPEKITFAIPATPTNARVGGVTFSSLNHPLSAEPVITWTESEPNQTYILRIYSGEDLLDTIEISGTYFKYTVARQQADNEPSHVWFELSSKRGDDESEPLVTNVPIWYGWGGGWGRNYGSVL